MGVLWAENASPRVCGMFYYYKATVQAVLLFSEVWNLTPMVMERLEGFHIWSVYHMICTNKHRRIPNGNWEYPSSEDGKHWT